MRFLCAKGTRTSKGKAGVGEEEEGGEAEVVAVKAARLQRTKCHNWRRILCEEKGMDQLISLAHLFVDYITEQTQFPLKKLFSHGAVLNIPQLYQ